MNLGFGEKIVDDGIGEYLGPFKVMAVDNNKKLIFIQDSRTGAASLFKVAQMKRYNHPKSLAKSVFTVIRQGIHSFSTPKEVSIYLTKVIHTLDPRFRSRS